MTDLLDKLQSATVSDDDEILLHVANAIYLADEAFPISAPYKVKARAAIMAIIKAHESKAEAA